MFDHRRAVGDLELARAFDSTARIDVVPNGVDDTALRRDFPEILPFSQKKNRIITVGRIGTKQKNSALLLKALEKIDPGDWEILFVGPEEPLFHKEMDDFFKIRPDLKDRVRMTGSVPERKALYEHYNQAKVFCLTSDWESFGIVLVEALYFGDAVITTDVGAGRDATGNGSSGRIFPPGDREALGKILEEIFSGKFPLEKYSLESAALCRKEFFWSVITENLYREIVKRTNHR